MKPRLTYALAMAAGADAADRQMRAAGRTRWSEDDANLAAKIAGDLLRAAGLAP